MCQLPGKILKVTYVGRQVNVTAANGELDTSRVSVAGVAAQAEETKPHDIICLAAYYESPDLRYTGSQWLMPHIQLSLIITFILFGLLPPAQSFGRPNQYASCTDCVAYSTIVRLDINANIIAGSRHR